MKKILVYSVIVMAGLLTGLEQSRAQHALFLNQGNITFERTTNVLAIMKENLGDNDVWGEKMIEAFEKGNNPRTSVQKFNLAFNGQKALYTPLEDEGTKAPMIMEFLLSVAGKNTVYTDLDSNKSVSHKTIYEDDFLVEDQLRDIHWKITDETRTIAGFQCRRANALVMDSIYVVAFYTDMIPTSVGPESFTGLPGMILGLALPHKHMTWFATRVSVSPAVDAATLVAPTANRRTETLSRKALLEKLQGRLSDWGKNGQLIIQNSML